MTHLAHPDERELLDSRVREAYYRRKENGPQQTHQYNYVLPDGSLRLIEWSWYVTPEGLMYAVGRDNTDRHKAEARLAHAMTHDAVTDLPRMERLEETLKDLIAGQPQRNVAVMFMDLDRFFSINESMGHTTADRVLAAVAGRLRKIVPAAGQLSRISGDEFLAVLPDCSAADANALAGQVQGALSEPIAVDGYKIRLTVSIGIAAYPDHGGSSVDLIRRAQAALVNAKRQGRDAICVFTAEQVHDIQDRQLLGNHLRNAVERNEMVLHYQPQYEAETHRLSGFEALIRWQSPQLGLIFPSRFISVAESIGVMPELGEWVIRETCRQMRAWQEAGHDGFTVSVNVAAQQLLRPGLADLVASALAEYGLVGDRLEIELTESSAMQNVERTRGTLHALKALGVNIALDDFGTGYSSLAYLKQFAVDKLKIDKSFVRDLPDDANDAAIARTIIGVGHQLRMRVSAEGVETGRQRDFLVAIGCDELQGFLFSPGVAAADATHMLASR
jgi:diguanylate cyclase (GGDEF)-like protein